MVDTVYWLPIYRRPAAQADWLGAKVGGAVAVLGWGCEPPSWGRGGRRGTGMVPFERAFMTSYRLSIVTFPLSLRVSEIFPLLSCTTPLFPTPPLVSPKFPHVPLAVGGWPLGYEEQRCWANCPHNFIIATSRDLLETARLF